MLHGQKRVQVNEMLSRYLVAQGEQEGGTGLSRSHEEEMHDEIDTRS